MTMKWRRESVLDLYKLVLGLVCIISPWLLAYAGGVARVDAWASGVLLVLLSAGALVAFAKWEEWLSLLAGLWMIAAPWVLGFVHTRAMHVSIGLGLAVAFIAALELWLTYYEPEDEAEPHKAGPVGHA
jgi:hypothetical protein